MTNVSLTIIPIICGVILYLERGIVLVPIGRAAAMVALPAH
jgi:hypothetical protein